MGLYERYDVDGKKVARAFTVDGSEEDQRHAALVVAGLYGWQKVDEAGEKPLTPKQQLEAEAAQLGLSTDGKADEIKARIAEYRAKLADLQKQAKELGLDESGAVADLQARIDAKLAE